MRSVAIRRICWRGGFTPSWSPLSGFSCRFDWRVIDVPVARQEFGPKRIARTDQQHETETDKYSASVPRAIVLCRVGCGRRVRRSRRRRGLRGASTSYRLRRHARDIRRGGLGCCKWVPKRSRAACWAKARSWLKDHATGCATHHFWLSGTTFITESGPGLDGGGARRAVQNSRLHGEHELRSPIVPGNVSRSPSIE